MRPRILVVDDNPGITGIISDALSEKDYQITIALNMENALLNFEGINYNIVISDIFMEGMGGIEGIKKIRALMPDIQIIAISGGFLEMSPEEALLAARKIGADAIMPKPLDLDELENTVSSLLEM